MPVISISLQKTTSKHSNFLMLNDHMEYVYYVFLAQVTIVTMGYSHRF